MKPARSLPDRESVLAERWAQGIGGLLRLEDGRTAHVVFPGITGGGTGPDFTGAIVEAGGDLLRGDVEIHLLASGWRAHGHDRDPAYEGVVLHVVGVNDSKSALTGHRSGRLIPILVLPPAHAGIPEAFTPPCALKVASGLLPGPALERLGLRRLRIKAARSKPLIASGGAGQALYSALLETLGGTSNRDAFASIARSLPLAALRERMTTTAVEGRSAAALCLAAALSGIELKRAGLRPFAWPERRLDAAGLLIERLWPTLDAPNWPAAVGQGTGPSALLVPGVGRALAIECMANAVLPVALSAEIWPEAEVHRSFLSLGSPAVYGRLKPLKRWLGAGNGQVFETAAQIQGGLQLHVDYCARGRCGRCPLSE